MSDIMNKPKDTSLETSKRYNEEYATKLLDKYLKTKDNSLLEPLIKVNFGLIYYVFSKMHIDYNVVQDEMLSYAYEGLLIAIKRYKPEKGKFSTYAYQYIHGYILKFFANKSLLESNFYFKFLNYKRRIEKKYDQKLEENIFLVDEILNLMVDEKVLPLKKYNARKQEILAYIPISLYEKNLSLIDDNSLYNETNHLIVREKLDNLLSVFGPRNKEILKLYFGFYDNSPLKVKEIASLYNLSETRIERIIKVSLRILEENYGDILLSLKDMLDDDYSLTFK